MNDTPLIRDERSNEPDADEADLLRTLHRLHRRRSAERRATFLAAACACFIIGASAREFATAAFRPDPVPAYRADPYRTRCGVLLDEHGSVLDDSPSHPVPVWE